MELVKLEVFATLICEVTCVQVSDQVNLIF